MRITTPLTEETVEKLKAGDQVTITGTIYVGRDAAHRRFLEALDKGQKLPFEPKGQVIYYMAPSPAKPGQPIGSAGPTTSYRMDPYTPRMLEAGLKGLIGKGNRSQAVKDALKKYKAVYFAAVGGTAALSAKAIVKAEVIAYDDLGVEAVRRLEVEDLPVIVVNDIYSGDAYLEAKAKYAIS
jgi:fumarate hydratase subunit beta